MPKAIEWRHLDFETLLGEGQAGHVWRARLKVQHRDLPVGTSVAVKRYKTWVLEEPGQLERIIRELELGRRISHPNLVRTLSLIRDPEGRPALVMLYYSGETLDNYLKTSREERRRIDVEFGFTTLGGLAAAVAAIHKADAIHRDVKPANIILSSTGPILMDLGVISSKNFPEQTTSGAFLGTIRYAAPEYLFGETYDSSIDLYALGAITYELFLNKPFPSDETQWARLIVAKSDADIEVDYARIRKQCGVGVAELINYVLGHTLTTPSDRLIKLDALAEAMVGRIWEQPWQIVSHQLVGGEPRVKYLGDWNKLKTTTTSPKTAIEILKRQLPKHDLLCLHKLLDHHYFNFSKVERPWRQYERGGDPFTDRDLGNIKKSLLDNGAIRFTGTDGMDEFYELHESVVAAYRLGYL